MKTSLIVFFIVLAISITLVYLLIYRLESSNSLQEAIYLNSFCESYGVQLTHEMNLSFLTSTTKSKIYDNKTIEIYCFFSPDCAKYGSSLLSNSLSCMCNVLTPNKIIANNICVKIIQ
jgi:hypothetical protein